MHTCAAPAQNAAQPPAQDRVVQLLKLLTEAPGPPGYEEPVRKIMAERMKPFADRISYDGLGSVIAQQGNSGPHIMLDAHMDELGGMVRRIRPEGFISMQMLGYWLSAALPDQRWVILGSKGPVLAVTDIWDAHIAPHDASGHPAQQDLYLDAGARSAADVAALGISPGDPVAPVTEFAVLANNRKLVAHVKEIAAGRQIPLQFDFVPGFGDDAGAIKLHNIGVPVTTVLVPARSTHAHNGIIDRVDFDRTVDLMVALIQSLDAATVAKLKSFE